MDSFNPNDFLECILCLELARDAVECINCNQIMCNQCAVDLYQKNCPNCRFQNFQFRPNVLARRMIGQTITQCPQCQQKTIVSNLQDHLQKCPNRIYKCSLCQFEGIYDDINKHSNGNHQKEIIDFLINSQNKEIQHENIREVIDPIGKNKNSQNFICRLGGNGKFYCGQPLNFKCGCCNGCGPTNGCNCTFCMDLDIKARCLPQGFLVNNMGATVRKGKTGHYYCGRKVMRNNSNYCGPDDGPACGSCEKIEKMSNIYLKI